ncbi:MAG: hypothetical protein KAR38_14990 [Calditrichia bacterium]|nr:hypothetical protein [Calditrichia bacterium]
MYYMKNMGNFKNGIILILLAVMVWGCEDLSKKQVTDRVLKQAVLLPESAVAITYFDFKTMKDSQFFDLFKPAMDSVMKCDSIEKIAKIIDIDKNIDEMFFAITLNEEQDDPTVLLVLNGHFYPENFDEFLLSLLKNDKKQEFSKEKYGIYNIYVNSKEKMAFSPVGNEILVIGAIEEVKGWIQRKTDNYQNSKLENEIKNLLAKTRYADGSWIITKPEFIKKKIKLKHNDLKKLKGLESLEQAIASFNVTDKFSFHGIGLFNDPEQTLLFHDALKGVLAMIKISASEDREAVDLINKLKTDIDGTKIEVNIKYSLEEVKKIQAYKKKHLKKRIKNI